MGKAKTGIIAAQLLLAAIVVNIPSPGPGASPGLPLNGFLQQVGSWQGTDAPMDDQIVKELKLDDHLSRSYRNGPDAVDVYIGYYRTSKKTAAAHSPLVCFPGQGWVIRGEKRTSLPAGNDRLPGSTVNGTLMTAQRGGNETRIFFWYQAWTKTYSSSFEQKFSLLWDRFRYGVEDNALVRVSTPVIGGRSDEADRLLADFLYVFYPLWDEFLIVGRSPVD